MSGLGSIESAMKDFFGIAEGIDVGKIEAIVQAIVTIAPAIEKGLVSAAPYVEAIVMMVKSGGAPSDDDWTALQARLDAGSAALQAAGLGAPAGAGASSTADGAKPEAKPAAPAAASTKGTGK